VVVVVVHATATQLVVAVLVLVLVLHIKETAVAHLLPTGALVVVVLQRIPEASMGVTVVQAQ